MEGSFRILVVDDEPRGVELLVRCLQKLGRVERAGGGEEAWELVRDADFDLVVTDQRIAAGTVILDKGGAPTLYHVLEGEIRIETDGAAPVAAGAGSTVGVGETLTRTPCDRRLVAGTDVWALRLEPDELFDVLTDHSDLLQSVFSSVIRRPALKGRRWAYCVSTKPPLAARR